MNITVPDHQQDGALSSIGVQAGGGNRADCMAHGRKKTIFK